MTKENGLRRSLDKTLFRTYRRSLIRSLLLQPEGDTDVRFSHAVRDAVPRVSGTRARRWRRSTPAELNGASVGARIVGAEKGPKIRGLTYTPKARTRRRWGHRQHYTTIEITTIAAPGGAKGDTKSDVASDAGE